MSKKAHWQFNSGDAPTALEDLIQASGWIQLFAMEAVFRQRLLCLARQAKGEYVMRDWFGRHCHLPLGAAELHLDGSTLEKMVLDADERDRHWFSLLNVIAARVDVISVGSLDGVSAGGGTWPTAIEAAVAVARVLKQACQAISQGDPEAILPSEVVGALSEAMDHWGVTAP